jgi:hypothetical protein
MMPAPRWLRCRFIRSFRWSDVVTAMASGSGVASDDLVSALRDWRDRGSRTSMPAPCAWQSLAKHWGLAGRPAKDDDQGREILVPGGTVQLVKPADHWHCGDRNARPRIKRYRGSRREVIQ